MLTVAAKATFGSSISMLVGMLVSETYCLKSSWSSYESTVEIAWFPGSPLKNHYGLSFSSVANLHFYLKWTAVVPTFEKSSPINMYLNVSIKESTAVLQQDKGIRSIWKCWSKLAVGNIKPGGWIQPAEPLDPTRRPGRLCPPCCCCSQTRPAPRLHAGSLPAGGGCTKARELQTRPVPNGKYLLWIRI